MNNIIKGILCIGLGVVAVLVTIGVIIACIWTHHWPSLNMIQGIINCWLGFAVFLLWVARD